MGKRSAVVVVFFMLAGVLFAQTEPKKANVRPSPAPGAAEPFDKADGKAMAGQCVTRDTEAGQSVMRGAHACMCGKHKCARMCPNVPCRR